MIDQTITTPPPAPSSNDIPSFKARFDAFLAWMVTFVSQLVTLISQINSTATTVNADATTASTARDAAVASANFKGTWTNQTTQIGQSWLYNGVVYMVLIAGNTSPTTSPSNWMAIPKVSSVNGFSPDVSGNIAVEATKGTAIPSASTITIGTAGLGDTIHITGTATITSLGNATAGVMRTLIFDGILTLTHNATSLILPDGSNIITAVGDSAEFVCDTTNNWKLLRYTKAITPSIPTSTNAVKGINYTGLLAEYTVSGSAVTSIDFSGLDINAHKSYRVELDIYNPTGTQISIYCFINGDTVLTNYYSQLLQGFSGSANGANNNNPAILQVINGQFASARCAICHSPLIVKPRVLSQTSENEGTALVSKQYAVCKTATVTNITQLTFTSSVASAIGLGSKIRIYRGDV